MRSARILLLILLAILAINGVPSNTERTLRREVKRNTTAALYRRATTTIQLKSIYNAIFIGVFRFGTPAQSFNLMIDTGAFYTVVADLTCTNCGDPPEIPVYHGGDSTTFHNLDQPFEFEFIDDTTVSGIWTADIARFGGIRVALGFGRATKMPPPWVSKRISGSVGLRIGDPTKQTPYPFPSTLETFSNMGALDNNVIGCRFVKNNPDQAGEMTIGSVDTTHVDGSIYYTPVIWENGQPLWKIPIAELQIAGRTVARGGTAILDTGSMFVLVPRILNVLFAGTGAQRQPNGLWTVPDPFPSDVTFVIGEQHFTIPREDVPMRGGRQYGELIESTIQDGSVDGACLLGGPFIVNHYVAFDFGNNAIGLGRRNDYRPPARIPDVNPEATMAAKALMRELWPDFETRVAEFPILADNYARILETFEEAALQADNVAKTRIGKELLARITGNAGGASREDVARLLRIEYGTVDAGTVAMAATQIMAADQNPGMSDEAVQTEVSGLMALLGFKFKEIYRDALNMLREHLIALFVMGLIAANRKS